MNEREILEKIKENQQQQMVKSEIVVIAIVLGLGINLLSSILYDQLLSKYHNQTLLSILLVGAIGLSVLHFTKQFFSSEKRIKISSNHYGLLSAGYNTGGKEREINNKFREEGLASEEFETISNQFITSLTKMISDQNVFWISNNGVKRVKRKLNDKTIELDISKDGVDAQLDIRLYTEPYPLFVDAQEKKRDYYNIYLVIEGYLNDSKHKESVTFYEYFVSKEFWVTGSIYGLFIALLGRHWGLINERSSFFHYLVYYDSDIPNKDGKI